MKALKLTVTISVSSLRKSPDVSLHKCSARGLPYTANQNSLCLATTHIICKSIL